MRQPSTQMFSVLGQRGAWLLGVIRLHGVIGVTAVALTAVVLAALVGVAPAHAQYDLGPLTLQGGASFSAEAYTVDGLSRRRAPATLTSQANVSFDLLGLRSGANITYSTDQNRLRQSVNRLAFQTSWAAGQVEAGDVAPTLGKYALRGTVLRGGAVEYRPGRLILNVAAGRSQRAVRPSESDTFRQPSYQQFTYAGRVGYGRERSTHVHLTGVYVRDVVSSLSPEDLAVETQLGTTEALTPQENLTVSPDVGIEVWGGRVRARTQVTASTITRNTIGPEDADGDLPFFASPFITDRRGTRIDYAGEGQLELRLDPVDLRLAYERVQPGFESLSVPQVRSDQEQISVQPSVSLLGRRVRLGGQVVASRNNLQNQRDATYRRLQLGVNTQSQITERFTVGGSYTLMRNENDPSDAMADPLAVQQLLLLHTATLSPSFSLQRENGLSHTVTLSGSLQRTSDRSDAIEAGLRPAFSTTNVSTTAGYNVAFPSGLGAGLTGNYVWSEASSTTTQVRGLTLSASQGFLDGDLRLNAAAGWSQNEVTTMQDAQASLALLDPSLNGDLQTLTATGADVASTGWYGRTVSARPRSARSDYAWYLSELMHGTSTGGIYSSDVAWALDQGLYDKQMLDELAATFEQLSTQWTGTVGTSYRLPTGNTLRLDVRTLLSRADAGPDFREAQVTLRYSHRF